MCTFYTDIRKFRHNAFRNLVYVLENCCVHSKIQKVHQKVHNYTSTKSKITMFSFVLLVKLGEDYNAELCAHYVRIRIFIVLYKMLTGIDLKELAAQ